MQSSEVLSSRHTTGTTGTTDATGTTGTSIRVLPSFLPPSLPALPTRAASSVMEVNATAPAGAHHPSRDGEAGSFAIGQSDLPAEEGAGAGPNRCGQ